MRAGTSGANAFVQGWTEHSPPRRRLTGGGTRNPGEQYRPTYLTLVVRSDDRPACIHQQGREESVMTGQFRHLSFRWKWTLAYVAVAATLTLSTEIFQRVTQ